MKTLLTITVLVSSVLSIFSSSLKLYEVPVLQEVVPAINKEKGILESNSKDDMKRIYISYDVSNKREISNSPVQQANERKGIKPDTNENYISVFGVKVPSKNT